MISIFTKSLGIKTNQCLIKKYTCLYNTYKPRNDGQINTQGRYANRRDNNTYKKLFKTENYNQRDEKTYEKNNQDQSNIADLVKNVNQINKEFLGIKVNTDYFKVYNEKTFQEAIKIDKLQTYKINDLPFTLKSTQQNKKQPALPEQMQTKNQNSAWKMLQKMISPQKLDSQLKCLVKNYFSDLIQKKRTCRMQPNFQVYARRVVQSLKASKWSFKLSKENDEPTINIKNVTVFKGVKVNRNDNYTVDSYKVNYDQQEQGIITYTLWKKPKEQYPESEWFAQKYINIRIQAQVSNGPIVEITQPNSIQASNQGINHLFTFEVDLIVPPSLSFLSLSEEQYLNSYRLKPNTIQITNVDNKNIWFNIAYKEDQKKNKLINKLL